MKQEKKDIFGRLFLLSSIVIISLLSASFSVSAVINNPPVADANGPYLENEGNIVIFDGSGSYDPDGDLLEYRWDLNNDGVYDTSWSTDPTTSFTWMDDYTGIVVLQVSDGEDCDTDTSCVTILNVAPTAVLKNNGPVDEGSMVTVSFENIYDPGSDTFTFSYDWDNDGTYDIIDSASATASYTWCDNGCYMVKGKIMDDDGGSNEYYTTVQVLNVAPILTVGADIMIYPGDTMISSGSFTDPGCDTWTATVDYGDGSGVQPLTLNGFTFDLMHQYDFIGTYTVTVTITDDDGGIGMDTLLVEVICLPVVYVDDNADPSWYDYSHVLTVQTGVDRVCPGGTVYVYNGSYYEDVSIYKEDITLTGVHMPGLQTMGSTCSFIHGSFHVDADCIQIEKFVFSANIFGSIQISEDVHADCVVIHHNKFLLECIDDTTGVINEGIGLADARYNHWGAYDGPSGMLADPISNRIADGYGVLVGEQVIFDPWAGIDATADASSTSVNVGDIIIFNSDDSFAAHLDGSCNDYAVRWDFDDGTYSFDANPSHVFTSEGTYQVNLRIQSTDPQLISGLMYDWDYLTITVHDSGNPLVAHAKKPNFDQYETTTNGPIQLFGHATGGTPPYSYNWYIGLSESYTVQNPVVDFDAIGTYEVSLTVTDDNGNQATDTAEVLVLGTDEMQVSITGPFEGIEDASVIFHSKVWGGSDELIFEWDFGDGSTSLKQIPDHVYKNPGLYQVNLTVTDEQGRTDTDSITMTISEEESITEINDISGGLFLEAIIIAGDEPVEWSITVDGNLRYGGSNHGSIPAHTSETVRLPLIIGFGKVDITVIANAQEKTVNGFLFGPIFVF